MKNLEKGVRSVMATVTFASKLKEDGSLSMPKEVVEELGLHPGDEVQVNVEAANGANRIEELEQARLQRKFDAFFDRLDTLTFESPTKALTGDPAEAGFSDAMDEKFRKLGFKS